MTVEGRRELVDKIFGAAAARGSEVDTDPLFRSWVEEWIAHEIDMDELRRRYDDLRRLRHQERRQRHSAAVVDHQVSSNATPALEADSDDTPSIAPNSLEAVLISLQKHAGGREDAGQAGHPD
jgi:hypothetical protein